MDADLSQFDWKTQEILRAIQQQDGAANTAEIRGETGIEDNNVVLYRLNDKLEPAGLVDLHQPDPENSRIQPKVATLTDAGKEAAIRLEGARGDSMDLSDKVEQLEARINTIEMQTEDIDNQEREVRHDEEFEELRVGLLGLRDYVIEEHGADLTEYLNRHR
jgi:DNA-binding PadR family transcriptional regulator